MPNELNELAEIRRLMTYWVTEIAISNALSYFDINKAAEGISRQLLNVIYDYDLVDLNGKRTNYPGIDLGDRKAGIAFQVTSRTDGKKITDTLEKFARYELYKEFPAGIRFLVLNEKRVRLSPSTIFPKEFDPERHILYAHTLIGDILHLYRTNRSRYQKTMGILQREFPQSDRARSLLDENDTTAKIANYIRVFSRMHDQVIFSIVHFPCETAEGQLLSDQLIDRIDKGAIIVGPSGCGKSLLTKWLALASIDEKGVPVLLEAKYYESDLNELIEREVGLFGFPSGVSFFEDSITAGRQVLLLLDGLNECAENKQSKLIAELEQIVQRFDAKWLISSQNWVDRASNLGGTRVIVGLPSLEVKTAIAGAHQDSDRIEPMLSVISTGMEARMLGEIKAIGVAKFSRFTLFETFIRQKLGPQEGEGYRLLVHFAHFLSEHITFTLSIRQAEQVMQGSGIIRQVLDSCIQAGLLRKNLTRISFSHEMFLNFFVADSIVRSSPDGRAISQALKAPKNQANRLFVLGAIDQPEVLREVLNSLADPQLLLGILEGDGGATAKYWAEKKLVDILRKVTREVNGIVFEIVEHDWAPLQVKKETLDEWSPQDSAMVNTIPFLLAKGEYLTETLALTGDMDIVCHREFLRLRGEPRERRVAIRTGIFAAIYLGHGDDTAGLTKIFSVLLSGIAAFFSKKTIPTQAIEKAVGHGPLSNGQFYLLLLLCRYSEAAKCLYPLIMDGFTHQWKTLPYHLRSQMIDQAAYSCASDEQRAGMIEILNTIHGNTTDVMESTNIFEALSALGALDDDAAAYVQDVESQIERLLSSDSQEEHFGEAAGIFNAQFDHPYASAFQTAIERLPEAKKIAFYKMAMQDPSPSVSFFVPPLLINAAKVLKNDICPLLTRFMESPVADVHSPSESLGNFIFAHLMLAQFGGAIISRLSDEPDGKLRTMFACGELFYWVNRKDLSPEECQHACLPAVKQVFNTDNDYAVESVWQTQHAVYNSGYVYNLDGRDIRRLTKVFMNQVAIIARRAIEHPETVKGIFEHSTDGMLHAIELLEQCGDSSDVVILKNIVEDPIWGPSAVQAIKCLEI